MDASRQLVLVRLGPPFLVGDVAPIAESLLAESLAEVDVGDRDFRFGVRVEGPRRADRVQQLSEHHDVRVVRRSHLLGVVPTVPPPSVPFGPAGDPASAPPAAGTGAIAPLHARATKVAIMSGYRMRPTESLQWQIGTVPKAGTWPLPDKHSATSMAAAAARRCRPDESQPGPVSRKFPRG